MKALTGRWWLLAPVALVGLATWTPTDDGPTLCPFALVTGHACPGCGLTRAMAYLIRGDMDRAVLYHPLAPLVALVAVAGAVWWFGRQQGWWQALPIKFVNAALSVSVVLLLGVWLGRVVTGTLPPV